MIDFPKKWNVIPIKRGDPDPKENKKPLINWRKYQEEQFPRKNFQYYEPCNYGVICGKSSHNLVILDFDFKGKIFFRNILVNLKKLFPTEYETYIGLSPHGLHIYYHIDGDCPKRQTQIKCALEEVAHVDILGEGGYALISPSTIDDEYYIPLYNKKVKTITRKKFDEIYNHYILKEEEETIVQIKTRKKPIIIKKFRTPFQWMLTGDVNVKELSKKANKEPLVYWTGLYAEALSLGYEPIDLFPILRRNQKGFDPKKAEYQVEYHLKEGNLDYPLSKRILKKLFPSYSGVEVDVWITIGNELKNEFDVAVMSDSNKLMIKEGNIYTYKTDEFFKILDQKLIERTLGKRYEHNVRQILLHIKNSKKFNRDNFCFREQVIPFINGYYDAKNPRFIKAEDTKKIFCYAIPHKYEKGEHKCPKFKKLLGEWLYGNGKITEEDIFEMIGYTMTMDVSQRKAFFILGPTTTGKTSFQNILEGVIGKNNRIGTSIQEFGSSRFSLDNMENKILNMVGDMSGSTLNDTSYFKLLTGGDAHIQAEIKGGAKYNFKNITKIWYNANSLPILKDKNDEAFHLRWIIVEFKNRFKTEVVGAITKIDRQITNDKEEMQGIIHEAIKGVIRLNKRGFFRPEILKGTTHIWNYKSDPMYAFIHDECEYGEELSVMALEFQNIFNKWLFKNYKKRLSPYKIREMAESLGASKERANSVDEDGVRRELYLGIGWKPDEIKTQQIIG